MTVSASFAMVRCLASGQVYSGEALARRLDVTVRDVRDAIDHWRELGLEIEDMPGTSYRLARPLELLSEEEVRRELDRKTNALVRRLEVLPVVDSTNSYLLRAAHHGTPIGSVCLAEAQTAGRGRRSRTWVSPFGSNIYLSLLTRIPDRPQDSGRFPLLVGMKVSQALGSLGAAGVCLKWPNDLVCEGAKMGGILIERVSGAQSDWVVGVGVNFLMAVEAGRDVDQSWIGLEKAIGRRDLARASVAARVIEAILSARDQMELDPEADLPRLWEAYDCTRGQRVVIRTDRDDYNGVGAGVDALGRFLLNVGDQTIPFAAGDVSLRWLD